MRAFFRGLILVGTMFFAAVFLACDQSASQDQEMERPARVEHEIKESQLNRITLSPEAEQRLGISLAQARLSRKAARRVAGGVIIPMAGREIELRAPASGIILQGDFAHGLPLPGTQVKKGTLLLRVAFFPSDGRAINSKEELRLRDQQRALVRSRLERLEKLLARGGASIRDVQTAREKLLEAEFAYRLAQARARLARPDLAFGSDTTSFQLDYLAPFDGIVQQVKVSPGETVSPGTGLLTMVQTDPVWVRVPLAPVEASELDLASGAQVQLPATPSAHTPKVLPARFVALLPPARENGVAMEAVFQLSNTDGQLSPGQRVEVMLNYPHQAPHMVIPRAAILVDMYGGSWVYERAGEHTYFRRRIQVHHFLHGDSALVSGLPEGANIVVVGAAELFGTELGELEGEE